MTSSSTPSTQSTQQTQQNQSAQEMPFLYVDIMTPYLLDNLDDKVRKYGPAEALVQAVVFGQEAVTFKGVDGLVSDNGKVVALRGYNGWAGEDGKSCTLIIPDLYIAGAVREAEEEIKKFMNDGLLIARFSIFYGGPSYYTGRLPEEAGYSLDIPKSVNIVRRLLTNDNCLEAIAARKPSRIRESLDELNKSLDMPIIATPHLEVALSLPKARRILIV